MPITPNSVPRVCDNSYTIAVHGGQSEIENLPAPPISVRAAIPLESIEQGWEQLTHDEVANTAYQRYSNHTVAVLEDKFSQLEGADHCLAFNSGMTACYAIFRSLTEVGDHIVTQHAIYHEISDLLSYGVKPSGVDVTFVDGDSVKDFVTAITDRTKLVFVESPTNPVLSDVPIRELSHACREREVILVVDNTLLTPLYQNPLRLGAALTLYSTTKTINGHGDVMGGVVCTNDIRLFRRLSAYRDLTGTILDPFSAWLTIRGLRTLPLRLERHSVNTEFVVGLIRANFGKFPVRTAKDADHFIENNITGVPGVVSLTLPSAACGTEFLRNLRLLRVATTFGNLESLAYHFGTFTRKSRDLSDLGIGYGLVRLSIGIEDPVQIYRDIASALSAVVDFINKSGY